MSLQFGAIAGNIYPEKYQSFVSILIPINLDIGFMLSASCFVNVDFYDRLLLATITPLLVLTVMLVTYRVAKKRNESSEYAIRRVRQKHPSAALVVMFVTYSSISLTVFQTFVCDTLDNNVSYLRADYSLTCTTDRHRAFKAYAILMVFVYPIGVPAIFSTWLARNRHDLRQSERDELAHLRPLENIWIAYKPSRYYYEVIEYGRRILLTGAAVFVPPQSPARIAIVSLLAITFLFISESLSPFVKGVEMGLYRWGNSVVLASMHVALLLKVDISEENNFSLLIFVGVLFAANVFMVAAVLAQLFWLLKEWRLSTKGTQEAVNPPCRSTSSGWLEDGTDEKRDGAGHEKAGGISHPLS